MEAFTKKYTGCLKVRQLVAIVAFTLFGSALMAEEKAISRGPANFIPNDEIESYYYLENELWVDKAFKEDNEGILRSVRDTTNTWEEREEYAKLWNLKSTGLYDTPEEGTKINYFQKNLLKYLDKRLAGEMKNADEGSAMHTVSQVHKALRPSSEVGVSENVKFKFKARVLQGSATMYVINPYVNYNTTAEVDGTINMHISKEIKEIDVKTGIDYSINNRMWIIYVDKKVTEQITARVSSSQNDSMMAMSGESDRTISINYNLPF